MDRTKKEGGFDGHPHSDGSVGQSAICQYPYRFKHDSTWRKLQSLGHAYMIRTSHTLYFLSIERIQPGLAIC